MPDSLELIMLKLKLQYFGHLMQRVDSLEKTMMLGWIGGRSRRGRQRMRWLDCFTDSMDVSLSWTPGVGDGQGGLACGDSWGHKESDRTERLNWTELDCSPPGSSVHEICQARILEWVAIPFSRETSQLRDRTWVSCTAGRFFTDWATRKYNISDYLYLFICLIFNSKH